MQTVTVPGVWILIHLVILDFSSCTPMGLVFSHNFNEQSRSHSPKSCELQIKFICRLPRNLKEAWETIVSYCWEIHFTWQEFTYYCRVALLYITLQSFMASPVIQQPSRQAVKSLTLNLSIITLTFWMRLVVLIVIVVNTVNTLQHVFMWSKPFRCYQESQVQAYEKLVWYKHMEININGLPFCLSPDNGADFP